MTADLSLDDPYLPLAFSLHNNPGGYALLAGAGISRGADLPTAWDIVTDLVVQICQREDQSAAAALNPDNVQDWYVDKFHKDLTYSGVLEEVAPTQHERESVLRNYFEPAGDSATGDGRPGPSQAHHAVAELMELGIIKVIVTMNFDHLFEDALRARGIDPVVVSTDAVAQGLAPLHTIEHCVIHLHGDYRDAASMLNTTAELGGYQHNIGALLERVISDYGLLVAGWSATHDAALRRAIAAHYRGHLTMGWIEPYPLTDAAHELVTNLGAKVLQASADDALVRLTGAVVSMHRRGRRHPLTPVIAADRIKRDLTGKQPAITAHDTLTAEFAYLEQLPALNLADYNDKTVVEDYQAYADRIDSAAAVSAGSVATMAYWGSETSDQWWLPEIERFAHPIAASGDAALRNLPLLVGARLVYAAGVALTASKRYDTLATVLNFPSGRRRPGDQTLPAARYLDWNRVYDEAPTLATNARGRFARLLSDVLTLSHDRVDEVWQEFEVLRAAVQIVTHPDFVDTARTYQAQARTWRTFETQEASPEKAQAYEGFDRARGQLARLAGSIRPHVFIVDANSNDGQWVSLAVNRLLENAPALAVLVPHSVTSRYGAEGQLLSAAGAVDCALAGVATYFSMHRNNIDFGYMGTGLWLDAESLTGS